MCICVVSASSNPLQSYGMDTHASVDLTDPFTHSLSHSLTHSFTLTDTYFSGMQLPIHRHSRWTQARRQNCPFQVFQGTDDRAMPCSSCVLNWVRLYCIVLYCIVLYCIVLGCCVVLYHIVSLPCRCLLCIFIT